MKEDKKYVISKRNLPIRFPLGSIVVTFLALDYWNAPEWLWGAFILFWVTATAGVIALMIRQEEVDILSVENLSDQFIKNLKKSKTFKQKLEEMEKKKQDEEM